MRRRSNGRKGKEDGGEKEQNEKIEMKKRKISEKDVCRGREKKKEDRKEK